MMKKIFLTALLASICFSGLWAQQFHAKMGASFVTLNENGEDIGPGTYATYFGFGFEVPFVPKSRQRVSLKTVDRSSSIFTADYWNKLIKGEVRRYHKDSVLRPPQNTFYTDAGTYVQLWPHVPDVGRRQEFVQDKPDAVPDSGKILSFRLP